MTTEPKFIPEKAVKLELSGGGSFKARLIDCVGYMVDGALGHEENEAPRLVKSPWFDHEVPFDLAAETGTRCVIREHATVGLVVTTDAPLPTCRGRRISRRARIMQSWTASASRISSC